MDIDWNRLLDDPAFATREIGRYLHRGELALFIGAGVSSDLGMPTWRALSRAIVRAAQIESKGINKRMSIQQMTALLSAAKRKDPAEFDILVKKYLYFKWTRKAGNWASNILVALGSLMSGSSRGRIDTVLSLNFDSVLEMYLRLYGFIAQPVVTFPYLQRRSDVRIFHSHGYLPLDSEDGSDTDILLSEQSYYEAMGNTDHHSRKMMEHIFGQRLFIAVGLSGNDQYSRSVLAAMALKSQRDVMGFWIAGPDFSDNDVASLKDSKIATIRLESHSAIPEFLFGVAREAAALMRL